MPFYVVRDSEGNEVSRYASTSPQVGAWPLDYTHTEFDPEQPVSDPAGPRVFTQLQWLKRFSAQERITIRAAAAATPALDDYLKLMDAAQEIDTSDPETIAGVQTLEAFGLLAQGRAEEILNAE